MTGRKGRMVTTVTGSVQYESRSRGDVPLEMLNVFEKERFVNGEKVYHPLHIARSFVQISAF